MTGSTLQESMFEDPVLQELVKTTRSRYGRAGLAVLAEWCRRELGVEAARSPRSSPLVGP